MVGKPSDEKECSKKLHLWSYLDTVFWTFGEQSYIVYYLIISYQRIKVYRVETIDMEISQWNNSIIETFLISISTTVLIVRDWIPW